MAPRSRKRAANDSTEASESPRKRVMKSNTSQEKLIKQPGKPTIRLPYGAAPSLSTHVLFIFVGPHRDLVTLHTNLLPERTLGILTATAQETRFHAVPETTLETFELYRLFLYTGKLFSHDRTNDQDVADNGRAEAHSDAEWTRLALAYLLGLGLEDEKFRNGVVDAMVEKVAETDRYPTGLATELYARTPLGDKLRSLIVDLHVWKGLGTGVRTPHDDADGPREFVQDVLAQLAAAGPNPYADDVVLP